ncbi:MAG: NADH:flavin oxidoreductase [Peptococcaceae bacterium BICA1-7]|nr:MAG: NADH:flavin oxidoreductase [Peptococcaceae bacterium BICA1-7]
MELLFKPIRIGGMELKNRISMPAIHHNYTPDGFVNDRLVKYYETRARGGAGLIIVGGCTIDMIGIGPKMIGLHDDKYIEGLKRLTGAVKGAGAKIAAQLYQAGRYTHSFFIGQQAIAPSPIASKFTGEVPREMTSEDIEMVIESFGEAALRAKKAGFDAVEIIASAGYLICQFLSPITNQRTDQYGGSWENRCRFGIEVVKRVRARAGSDFTVLVRLSGNDFMPGSNTNKEAALFAAELEKAGADCFNVTGGWHETRVPQITGDLPRGGFAYLASGVKAAVSVPVIASNRINDPEVAERILISGQADMVNIGRPMIADPHFANKAQNGRHKSIRKCLACNQGCMDMVFSAQEVHCAVNPLAGREYEISVEPAASARKVLVIGGGPAGMEAALTAASRGHQVTLWEKSGRLGGQVHYAAAPSGKKEFLSLVYYYEHELNEKGVKVELNREATAGDVVRQGADVVVVATGAGPAGAPFMVSAPEKVYTALEVLDGTAILGREVVVVGGGAVGCETAVTIAEMGTISAETLKFLMENEAESYETLLGLLNRGTKNVTVVELLKGIGRDIGKSTRWVVMKNIKRLGIKVIDQAGVKEVNGQGVLIEREGQETLIPADSVVLSVGSRPVNGLAGELQGKVSQLHIIGDASSPRKITEAIREGFELAVKI